MRSITVLVVMLTILSASLAKAKDELQVGDLIGQHLNSIGTDQARGAVKSRAAQGTVQFKVLNGAGGEDGKQVFVSEGDKLVSLLKLPNPSYHGERFVSDGKKTVIAELRPGVYSNLGQFVLVHNEILTEGLWGGTLSTGWALAHLDERHARLKYQGLKKMGGRELHRVDYAPKHSDLEIQLYFEPGTFRHVMTVYSLTISPQIGRSDQETARQQETHYRLEERFADFKNIDNLTLPGRWTIQFTSDVPERQTSFRSRERVMTEGQSQGSASLGAAIASVSQFEVTVTNISHKCAARPEELRSQMTMARP